MARYSDKFKADAKALALQSSDSYESLAKKLGISSSTLRNWVTEGPTIFKDENVKILDKSPIELRDYILKLEEDLADRNKEIKFLKKVAFYFAQNQKIES